MLRKGYTFDEIARIAGCTKRSVVTAVRHHGIRYPIVMVSEEQKKRLDLK
ncbi:MAG: hypothetical protein Q4Q53_07915 [Methanocorpusculum sp.]|nr:hypothetical protein [Methanocorpusculum sp.]